MPQSGIFSKVWNLTFPNKIGEVTFIFSQNTKSTPMPLKIKGILEEFAENLQRE